jgi:uncharacterized protein
MFRRRTPLGRFARLGVWIRPRGGWRRALRYIGHRLGRMSESPHRIAAGLATGVAVSVTPLLGVHVALAALLALALRGNLMAALLGTLFGNPWTLPVIWVLSYRIGLWLLPSPEGADATPHFVSMFADLTRAALSLDGRLFVAEVWPVLRPMLAGSVPLALAAWIAVYAVARAMIGGYRERRRLRRGDAPEGIGLITPPGVAPAPAGSSARRSSPPSRPSTG